VTAAEFAAMADPDRNPQFRRGWTGPPLEKETARARRRSAPQAELFLNYRPSLITETRSDRQAAERLFAPNRPGDRR